MAKAANKMGNVYDGHLGHLRGDIEVLASRMAKMRVTVTKPAKPSAFKKTVDVMADAMNKAEDAELNTRSKSRYRNVFGK